MVVERGRGRGQGPSPLPRRSQNKTRCDHNNGRREEIARGFCSSIFPVAIAKSPLKPEQWRGKFHGRRHCATQTGRARQRKLCEAHDREAIERGTGRARGWVEDMDAWKKRAIGRASEVCRMKTKKTASLDLLWVSWRQADSVIAEYFACAVRCAVKGVWRGFGG